MKSNKITRFVIGTGISLALAAAFAFPGSATAADQLKGAQIQIGERPAQVQALPPLDLNAATPACSSCTNATKPFATSAGRGAFVKTGVTVTHECPSRKTAIVTVGAGKAKTDTAVHTCGSGATASCCGGMAGM
jgi:hypothetical protein